MNHRKHKQAENQKKKRMYTPEGYINDPADATCPHCGKKSRPCSYVNSLSRAWARDACSKRSKGKNNGTNNQNEEQVF
jgi:hypothetical protein